MRWQRVLTSLCFSFLSTGAIGPAIAQTDGTDSPNDPPGTIRVGRLQLRPMLEVRERFESRIGPYVASGVGDNSYFVGSRARLGLDARFESLRIVVQFADARSFGQQAVGVDGGATTGLHQGFFDVAFGGSYLRIGRQEVSFGRQRMIGALNWSTTGRSFDALRLHLGLAEGTGLDVLFAVTRWVRRVTITDEAVDPPAERSTLSTGDYLGAIHFSWARLAAFGLDAYVLYRHDGATEGNIDRDRDIASPGIRLHGNPAPGLTYDVEGIIQAGRAARERHLALAAALELSYVFQVPMRPGLSLGGSFASGGAPGDTLTELDNFYPTNHLYYGAADLLSLRNLLHGFFRLSAAPTDLPLKIALTNHVFALASPSDRWANAGGRTVGLNETNDERLLGYELDINVAYAPFSWLKLAAGYSVFIPTAGAENLGHTDPTHWAYFMIGSMLP